MKDLNALTHKQLLDKRADVVRWLVEGLVRVGAIGFIAGEPKTSKSWLALHIAQCVATGARVLGHFNVPAPAKVLYIQEEDSVETVTTRYRLLERGHGIPEPVAGNMTFCIQSGFRADADDATETLTKAVKDCGAALLIVDVLNKVHSLNDSQQTHMTKIMSVFEKVRRETGVSVLIVHHFSKGSPGSRGNQRMRGSSVLAGWSENSLYLSRNGGLVAVEVENKFAETPNFGYAFGATDGGVRLDYAESVSLEDPGPFKSKWQRLKDRESYKKRKHLGFRSMQSVAQKTYPKTHLKMDVGMTACGYTWSGAAGFTRIKKSSRNIRRVTCCTCLRRSHAR